jgi:bacillithiol biosynthesis deacetylase BshB1
MAVKLDFLAVGPHPDDAEIGAGAFLLKMKKKGYKTGILTLTEGDMGAGTPEMRKRESIRAAEILELDAFEILNLGDTRLEDNFANRVAVASVIRKYRPTVVLTTYFGLEPGRGRGHADHIACGYLVTHAANFSHLDKFPAEGKPHAVKKVLYFFSAPFSKPTFVVEVDEEYPTALKALAQHESQFSRPERQRFYPTRLETTGRFFGAMIGAEYGQAFYLPDALKVEDPLALFR